MPARLGLAPGGCPGATAAPSQGRGPLRAVPNAPKNLGAAGARPPQPPSREVAPRARAARPRAAAAGGARGALGSPLRGCGDARGSPLQGVLGAWGAGFPVTGLVAVQGDTLCRVHGVWDPPQGAGPLAGCGCFLPVPPPLEIPTGAHAGHARIQAGPLRGRRRFPACNKRHLSSPRVKPRGGADPYRRGPQDHKRGAAGRHPLRGATRMPLGERGCSERPESRRAPCGLAAPLPAREKGALGPSVVPGWWGHSGSAKHRWARGLW